MVDAIMTLALCVALYRRPGVVSLVLACAYLYGCALAEVRSHEHLRPLIIAGDAAVIYFMNRVKGGAEEPLARVSVAFSILSMTFGFIAAWEGWRWNTYALAINVTTILQAVFATGFCDGLLAWVGHRYDQFRDRNLVRSGLVGAWR